MDGVALGGLYLLALGALLGWPVALTHIAPDALRAVGVRSPRRLLQMHLDYVLMGLILIAVGVALPTLPTWVAVPLVIGTIVNPLLFLPLAIREEWSATVLYRGASVLSFAAMSFGAVGSAWYGTTLL